MNRLVFLCVALAAFVIAGATASAALKVGDQLVYTVKTTQAAGGPGMDAKVTINVDRIETDGSAHANATIDMSHMPSAKVEATISRFGEIVGKSDVQPATGFQMPLTPAAGKKLYEKQMAAAAPGMLQMNVMAINAIASAVARHKTLKAGASWQAPGPGSMVDDITYKVTGREQHLGRDSYVIALQSPPGASSTTTGTAYYDPAAHVVVALHCEMKMSQGNQVVDAELAQ